MATTSGVYPCYENQFEVGAVGEASKQNGVMNGIADCESFQISFDNGVEEWHPFEQEGWVRRLQTAKGITISVTAKRNVGDAGNDFIAGLAWKNGRETEGDLVWNFPDGTKVTFADAVINVTNVGSGASTDVAPLEFDVMSNGKPTITLPSP